MELAEQSPTSSAADVNKLSCAIPHSEESARTITVLASRRLLMDHTGDTRHQFDPADPGAVAEAERRFKELTGSGFTAAKRLDNGKSEVVKSFDPAAEETLFIPRLQGG
jgi:hypothetical protein